MGCLLLASSAASLCALGMLTCCTCGCAPTVYWPKGFVAFLPVLRSPACSGSASSCGFSSPIWSITFAMGSPLRGRVSFTTLRVCLPRAPALRQVLEAMLAEGCIRIALGPGPGFPVVSS